MDLPTIKIPLRILLVKWMHERRSNVIDDCVRPVLWIDCSSRCYQSQQTIES